MKIGIAAVGTSFGSLKTDNLARAESFGRSEDFVRTKIGFTTLHRLGEGQTGLDLCLEAWKDLCGRAAPLDDIDFLTVVTQNPDGHGLPHMSARLHGTLGFSPCVAAFDLSLGCSGYVYALSVATSFMEANGLRTGLVFTADPYSSILDHQDQNTELLFGDAATCTLLTSEPRYRLGKGQFATEGALHKALHVNNVGKLVMSGRDIFNFTMRVVPEQIRACAAENGLALEQLELVLLHQASRHIVSGMAGRLGLAKDNVPFLLEDVGNCISSTLPCALSRIWGRAPETILLCGFGVGLSWATNILFRVRGDRYDG